VLTWVEKASISLSRQARIGPGGVDPGAKCRRQLQPGQQL
jgi:hypothetical protein